MSANVELKEEPASPCVGVCKIDPHTQLCEGCFRSLTEIAEWIYYSPQQKRALLLEVDRRGERILKRPSRFD